MKTFRVKMTTTRGGSGFELQMLIRANSLEMAGFLFAEKLITSNGEVSGLYRDLLKEIFDLNIEATEV